MKLQSIHDKTNFRESRKKFAKEHKSTKAVIKRFKKNVN